MCSSSKGGQDLKVKKVLTSSLDHSQLSDFVAIANAADARREKREQEELEARKQSERIAFAEQEAKASLPAIERDSFWDRLFTFVLGAYSGRLCYEKPVKG